MKGLLERQQRIKELLEKNGYVTVQDLSEELDVTGATIRKDLRLMEEQNLLRRKHGGATEVRGKVMELPINDRNRINTELKHRIAVAAAKLVKEDDSLAITSGSTIEMFVRTLEGGSQLNVVTPSIRIGAILAEKQVDVYMLGGKLNLNSLSVRDAYSMEGLRHIHCSKAIFSCDAVDIEAGVTSAYVEEARLTAALQSISSQNILLADSTKIGKCGFGKICDMNAVDILITDDGISERTVQKLENIGVQVIIA